MSAHNTQAIPAVSRYFGTATSLSYRDTPIITQVFTPGKGWKLTGYNKRVSASRLRKLKAEGVTHVTLTLDQRSPDFTIAELLRSARNRRDA